MDAKHFSPADPSPLMRREDLLISALQAVLDEWDAWQQSEATGREELPEPFLVALDDCCTIWESGDIPERCRSILLPVNRLTNHYKDFAAYVSSREPTPRREFWETLGELKNALTWAPPAVAEFYCEPIAQLMDEKVSPHQIALMYSHEGRGPFLVNGQPQPALVQREFRNPGSVLPADFVHPRTIAEREAAAQYTNFVALRAKQLKETQAVQEASLAFASAQLSTGPETVEDLLAQGCSDDQISRTKVMPIDAVRRERERWEISKRERWEASRRGSPNTGDRATIPFSPNVTAHADGDDDAPAIPDSAIAEYIHANPTATNGEAAKALGVETRRVAVVRKASAGKVAA